MRGTGTKQEQAGTGTFYAVGAQLIWGCQPLFWSLLDGVGATAVLAHRVVWSLLLLCVFVAVHPTSRAEALALLRSPEDLRSLVVSGAFIGASWAVYIHAIVSGRVVEASLALLLAPLLGAVLGVVVLREHLRRAQWSACALGAVALGVLVVGYGGVPWAAFAIATTMVGHMLVRKRRPLPAVAGTALEIGAIAPIALAFLLYRGADSAEAVGDPETLFLLLMGGLITVLPSTLRTAALARIPLAAFGLLSYLNPALQFSIGAWVLREPVSATSWVGFTLIWGALALFAVDGVRAARPRSVPEPVPRA